MTDLPTYLWDRVDTELPDSLDTRLTGWYRRLPSASGFTAAVSGVILTVIVAAAVFAPVVAPASPTQGELMESLQPPALFGGTWSHPLGTDNLGRDVLARLVYGARISLVAGFVSVVIAALIGTLLGVWSGYSPGVIDSVIMRVVEMQLSFPTMLLALLIAALLSPGLTTVLVAIIVVYWSYFARISRAEVLKLRHADYIALARVAGAGPIRITIRHLAPNMFNTIFVMFTLQVAAAITFEAALSFLGLGIQPPQASWGSMLGTGRNYVTIAWWLSVVPGLAIFITVLALNLVGDWLRDRLDPRSSRMA